MTCQKDVLQEHLALPVQYRVEPTWMAPRFEMDNVKSLNSGDRECVITGFQCESCRDFDSQTCQKKV